jgi:hypothetical protein
MVTITTNPYGYRVWFCFPGMGVRGYGKTVKRLADAFVLIRHHHGEQHDRRRCGFCKDHKARAKGGA